MEEQGEEELTLSAYKIEASMIPCLLNVTPQFQVKLKACSARFTDIFCGFACNLRRSLHMRNPKNPTSRSFKRSKSA